MLPYDTDYTDEVMKQCFWLCKGGETKRNFLEVLRFSDYVAIITDSEFKLLIF